MEPPLPMRSTNEEAGGAKARGDERVRVPTIVITILSGCFDGQGGVDGTVPRASPREQRLVSKNTYCGGQGLAEERQGGRTQPKRAHALFLI